MINVTKSYLPNISDYTDVLKRIWESGQITNNGDIGKDLSDRLTEYLSIGNIELVANGTIAIQIAIKALGIKGEVITTPFSYVATTNAVIWEGCTPIFVDIDKNSLCINPDNIESAITDSTSAILATHVYGYPCDVDKIQKIADKYNLKVIYDAAHAFGVKYKGKSLLDHGNISTLSFHATKLFHTGEGGAIVGNDKRVMSKVNSLKRFGHNGEDEYFCEGINGKLSELNAAMGLCVLENVDEIILHRKKCSELYDLLLASSPHITRPTVEPDLEYNYAYYPIIFSSEEQLKLVRATLNNHEVYPRRYFYPSLNTLPYLEFSSSCPVSESIASRVLALPLSHDLSLHDVDRISKLILGELSK